MYVFFYTKRFVSSPHTKKKSQTQEKIINLIIINLSVEEKLSNFLLLPYILFMLSQTNLLQKTAKLLFNGHPSSALESIKQCIELSPSPSQHYVTKALIELTLGNRKDAQADLSKAIVLDYLNHHAYFNLFSIQLKQNDLESAFKNLCCCLSVVHLLRAEREQNIEQVQLAIDYCFNNKEARMLNSILKLQAGKHIEALNQINYALYLAPSHPILKVVQERVYKAMGMKELKAKNTPFQKPKYDRLETNKQVANKDKIKNQIDKLLKEYNQVLKTLELHDLYKVTLWEDSLQNKDITQRVDIKEEINTPPVKFYLSTTDKFFEQTIPGMDSIRQKQEKQSTAYNSQHIFKQQSFKATPLQPFFMMDSSIQNMSISNISQNSNIKMNKIIANLVDFSDSKQSHSNNNISQTSCASQSSNGELILPLRLSQQKNNEKIVVTLQRTAVNEQGQTQKIEQLYEVVEGRSKLELIKVNK